MSRATTIAGALGAAAAAWLSTATLGFTGAAGVRLAILPLSVPVLLLAAAAAAAVVGLRRAGASLLPLALLAFLLLPWLPLSLPSAFLLWVWPLSLFLWIAVLMLMLVSLPREQAAPGAAIRAPRIAAGVMAGAIFALSAWGAAPMIPGGDEPHYLIITQSLLLDRSLTIENVHRRGDYRAYYGGELQPHVQRRSRDGRIYSMHAPGLPALVAPAFALGGHRAVVLFLVLVAAAGSALAWHCAWLATRRTDAAWFAWAAVTLPVTAIFQSFMVYPDGPGGVLALTGSLGAAARRRGSPRRRSRRAPSLAAARRRAGPAAVAALALCRARGGARVAHPPAARLDEESGREGGRVSLDSGDQRGAVGRLLHRHLRPGRSLRAVRARWRHRLVRLRARWPWRPAVRSALRPRHLRAGDGCRVCRAGGDVLPSAFPPPRPGTAVRDHAVPVDGHALRHVVGRLQPAGAVLRAGAAAVRDSGGRRVDTRHGPRHAHHRGYLGGADRLRLGDCHLRLSRPAGVQYARRAVALAGVARAARRSHDRRTRLGTRHGPAAVSRHRHLDRGCRRGRHVAAPPGAAALSNPPRSAGV